MAASEGDTVYSSTTSRNASSKGNRPVGIECGRSLEPRTLEAIGGGRAGNTEICAGARRTGGSEEIWVPLSVFSDNYVFGNPQAVSVPLHNPWKFYHFCRPPGSSVTGTE